MYLKNNYENRKAKVTTLKKITWNEDYSVIMLGAGEYDDLLAQLCELPAVDARKCVEYNKKHFCCDQCRTQRNYHIIASNPQWVLLGVYTY